MIVEKMRMVILLFVVKTTTMAAQASLPNRHIMMVDEKMRMTVLVIFVKTTTTTTTAVLVTAALFPVFTMMIQKLRMVCEIAFVGFIDHFDSLGVLVLIKDASTTTLVYREQEPSVGRRQCLLYLQETPG
jgi:hypothetical protein